MALDEENKVKYTLEDFTPEGRKRMYEIFENTRKCIDESSFLGKDSQNELRRIDRETRARYEAKYAEVNGFSLS